MNIDPPFFAEKKGQEVSVGISLAPGHTAQFRDDVVRFESGSAAVPWVGTIRGYERLTEEEHTHRDIDDRTAFDATAVMEGGAAKGSRRDSYSDTGFGLTVVEDAPFPNNFTMQLPVMVVDGTAVQLPVVNFAFGHALGLCGCCGV